MILFCGSIAMAGSAPMQVEVSPAVFKEKTIRSSLSGSIQSLRVSRLSPRTDGLVETVEIEPGDAVEKGAVLLKLDDDRARLALESLRIEKQSAMIAKADAERLVEGVRELTE